jgi:hypothetical protein
MVVAAAINDMKSDLDLTEFRATLPLVSRLVCGTGSENDRDDLEHLLKNLCHWRRVVAVETVDEAMAAD